MTNLPTKKPMMTIFEVSSILGVTPEAIKKHIRELFPDLMKNGIATLLDEKQVTMIKLKLRPTTKVVASKTNLEKKMIIQQAIIFLNEEVETLKQENILLNKQIDHKDEKLELLSNIKKNYITSEIAKELGFKSAQVFNKQLQVDGIQYKKNGTWMLKSKYCGLGYEYMKQTILHDGEKVKVVYSLMWTQKGREFLLNKYNG